MRKRTTDPKSRNFRYYGGRGIRVCDEWRWSFPAFFEWARANGWEPGLSIDRIDNHGDYEPGNCRFVTLDIQNQNRRFTKLSPGKVQLMRLMREVAPKIYTLRELAEIFGVSRSAVGLIINRKQWKNVP